MKDREARTLAALGVAAVDTALTYGVGWLFGNTPGLTTSLVVFSVVFVFVLWVLDRLAALNPDDHDS